MKRKNKKGWIRIVEAFIAILLITGILLIVISEEHLVAPDPDSDIYVSQLIILRSTQYNDTLRQLILNVPTTPVESDEGGFPPVLKSRIEYLTPSNLECQAKICEMELACNLNEPPEKNIYAQTIAITVIETQVEDMDPKQLKLFCWRK